MVDRKDQLMYKTFVFDFKLRRGCCCCGCGRWNYIIYFLLKIVDFCSEFTQLLFNLLNSHSGNLPFIYSCAGKIWTFVYKIISGDGHELGLRNVHNVIASKTRLEVIVTKSTSCISYIHTCAHCYTSDRATGWLCTSSSYTKSSRSATFIFRYI